MKKLVSKKFLKVKNDLKAFQIFISLKKQKTQMSLFWQSGIIYIVPQGANVVKLFFVLYSISNTISYHSQPCLTFENKTIDYLTGTLFRHSTLIIEFIFT